MINEDLPIIQKMYEFYRVFYQFSVNFPKKDKFTLGQRCENHIVALLEDFLLAGKSKREHKGEILFSVSVKLDTLKLLIRLLKDLKTIDLKKYVMLEEQLYEIGKMLGGWIKSLK